MKTLSLDNELQDRFFEIKREGSACWRKHDWLGLEIKMQEAWEIIPEPKLQYDVSFLAAWMMCEALLQQRNFEKLRIWIEMYNQADLNRIDAGERNFMEGRFFFAQGLLGKAKVNFEIAYQKSEGRLFKASTNNAHDSYFEDYKTLLDKEIIRPTDYKEMLDVALQELKKNNYPYSLSLLYDCINIKLDDSIVYVNKGICHFELNELDQAAESFTKAYMLEGEEIFKNQNAKYFEFLKTKINIEQ